MTQTANTSEPGRRRAPAMPPDARRAMIVAAALPLVVEYGATVTTAQVAKAAGIGEGTIFRVFADKDALMAACLAEAARPDDLAAHLQAISLEQPLQGRLMEAAETLRGHLTRWGSVVAALATTGQLDRRTALLREQSEAVPQDAAAERNDVFDRTRLAIAALFEPDRDRLRWAPETLADIFQRLIMSLDRPSYANRMSLHDLVDLVLNGAEESGSGQ